MALAPVLVPEPQHGACRQHSLHCWLANFDKYYMHAPARVAAGMLANVQTMHQKEGLVACSVAACKTLQGPYSGRQTLGDSLEKRQIVRIEGRSPPDLGGRRQGDVAERSLPPAHNHHQAAAAAAARARAAAVAA